MVAAFTARGVALPWQHQAAAADAPHAGQHVVLATGTASGKSLAYQLPALSAYMGHAGPSSTYWYLSAAPELLALAARGLTRAG